VVEEINCLEVTMEDDGGWNEQPNKIIRTPRQMVTEKKMYIQVKVWEDMRETLSEFTMTHGAEVWGLDGGWKETDGINRNNLRICLRYPGFQRKYGWISIWKGV
jgi:hypothetical protein